MKHIKKVLFAYIFIAGSHTFAMENPSGPSVWDMEYSQLLDAVERGILAAQDLEIARVRIRTLEDLALADSIGDKPKNTAAESGVMSPRARVHFADPLQLPDIKVSEPQLQATPPPPTSPVLVEETIAFRGLQRQISSLKTDEVADVIETYSDIPDAIPAQAWEKIIARRAELMAAERRANATSANANSAPVAIERKEITHITDTSGNEEIVEQETSEFMSSSPRSDSPAIPVPTDPDSSGSYKRPDNQQPAGNPDESNKLILAAKVAGVCIGAWIVTEAVLAYKNIPAKEWKKTPEWHKRALLVAKHTVNNMMSRPGQGAALLRAKAAEKKSECA